MATDDHELIRTTCLRLWSEHLRRPAADLTTDPTDVVDRIWRPTAEEQATREREGRLRTHRLTLLPGVSRRTGRLQGLLVDG